MDGWQLNIKTPVLSRLKRLKAYWLPALSKVCRKPYSIFESSNNDRSALFDDHLQSTPVILSQCCAFNIVGALTLSVNTLVIDIRLFSTGRTSVFILDVRYLRVFQVWTTKHLYGGLALHFACQTITNRQCRWWNGSPEITINARFIILTTFSMQDRWYQSRAFNRIFVPQDGYQLAQRLLAN